MARRAAIVEEFDDDTDLPLPSRPLDLDARGPLLEEIGASDDEDNADDTDEGTGPGTASHSQFRPPASLPSDKPPSNTVTDITPYKKYVFRAASENPLAEV
jgi:signal recognition particle subunit SRP19